MFMINNNYGNISFFADSSVYYMISFLFQHVPVKSSRHLRQLTQNLIYFIYYVLRNIIYHFLTVVRVQCSQIYNIYKSEIIIIHVLLI